MSIRGLPPTPPGDWLERIDITPRGCWLWPTWLRPEPSVMRGYLGRMYRFDARLGACDEPRCVNPAHTGDPMRPVGVGTGVAT